MGKPALLKPPHRIPEGMVRVAVSPADAPTELLPALADVMPPNTPGRTSGEYRVSPETEALLKSVRDAAAAETRRDMLMQQLTAEVAENTAETKKCGDKINECSHQVTAVKTTQEDHGRQLAAIWEEKKSKNSAWHQFWPLVLSTLLSSAIMGAMAFAGAFSQKSETKSDPPATKPAATSTP